MAMAVSATTLSLQNLIVVPHPTLQNSASSLLTHRSTKNQWNKKTRKLTARAADLLGDVGARDPFPAEIESNFGEKVLGNYGTDHIILIPKASALSLASKDCTQIPRRHPPMPYNEAASLLKKVVGWRIMEEDNGMKLKCLWKVRNFRAGIQLIGRIAAVSESAGHHPDLQLEAASNCVTAKLWTPSTSGLSMNDFIVAAKIDQIKISDLIPQKRVWA
eukprot:TRINITY_DN1319_c0_g1_i1.p1 TRINITY_DN1319_c0_g1~~TRINITY_DN1319_c0_g1_i1.p1  ORF type:complete len:218 (+),score=48.21 TRINITY_DN1319_c0_g1_i1:58-711(+)